MKLFKTLPVAVALLAGFVGQLSAQTVVYWTDWTSGTSGINGSATGVLQTLDGTVNVSYTGEIAFIQTNGGGANYWNPSAPYISEVVPNAPDTTDIIALSQTSIKTLTFSEPVDNLFFAVVSLNGNGYIFDSDFEVVSYGSGYWGSGTLTRTDLGNGTYVTSGTGEPHGVLRFTQPITEISWTSQTNEYWNGFTVGTYGIADTVPEPSTWMLVLLGIGSLALVKKRAR